jgi:hypothetical protein
MQERQFMTLINNLSELLYAARRIDDFEYFTITCFIYVFENIH